MKNSNSVVVAVDRCIDILEYISNANAPVSVKEISINLKIPNASCFRIMKNLQMRGYIEEGAQTSGQYVLGFKVLDLADKKKSTLDVRTIAVPYMNQLSKNINQTVQLGRLEDAGVIYIEQALSMSPIKVIGPLFTPLAVNVSASGKVLCAFLPLYEQTAYIEKADFVRLTDNSIMDKVEFKRQLQLVRKNYFAVDIEEYSTGIGCLAVPIFDYRGRCVASLGLTGNIEDYRDEEVLERMKRELSDTAKQISAKLGARLEEAIIS